MTGHRSARLASLVALFAACALAGCSTVPSSSPTVRITQAAAPPAGAVGIEPPAPVPGATPEEVVRGFIDANASTVRNHPVARQYLTEEAAAAWRDTDGLTVISGDYAPVRTAPGVVEVTAAEVGTVDQRGSFTVGTGEVYDHTFTLTEESGEWRISDPPDGLLMLEPDFARTYEPVDAYFLDQSGTRVVPDPRYLVDGGAQPNTLVERLIDGPSPQIAAGVLNPLADAELRSTVSTSGRTATVDLTFPADVDDATLQAASAQLVWSLDQLDVTSVRVLRDGQELGLPDVPEEQRVDDWQQYDPDVVPADAVGHYVADGALRRASDGSAAPGPAGEGVYGLESAAVSVDGRTGALGLTAGVSTSVSPSGAPATLYAGQYGEELAPALTGSSFTEPTTAGTRAEVWTVRDGAEVIRLPEGGASQTVSAPTLPGLGRATTFQLSPDGLRAAVVIDGPEGGQLYVGTVVRADDAVSVRDLRSVTPAIRQVVDVAWRNAGSLLLLAGDPSTGRTVPYEVSVDGWGLSELTTSGLPAQPTGVAAAPGRQPLVSAGGTLWQLPGGNWVTAVRGAEPLPGGAPFYPM
ncbi:LpqB family beta-propeller domain-containing protein [Modestobacter sp. VKM Ac-2984]|uniref:LpqB family beta-propeller domain-containing protein n=1 Tax=Modestobacter sp. VKM Ac-2984 TaxID=3004138 RepID=UPI0022AA8203|nr:LpqB family beta-propeller domain-containing protein [Modestobacter sp. VKM Ac-2984]MCZ2816434.1 LpqB family beta-propeller domain-containing protein [Modestobacter sp. VKM Ac-2984]